jgi:hypothetical protein
LIAIAAAVCFVGCRDDESDAMGSAVVAARSATVTWAAPQTNADGSALSDLAGFRVYYGNSPGRYAQSVYINNPKARGHTLSNLAPGTWYIVVKAVDTSGNESAPSPEVSKTIK